METLYTQIELSYSWSALFFLRKLRPNTMGFYGTVKWNVCLVRLDLLISLTLKLFIMATLTSGEFGALSVGSDSAVFIFDAILNGDLLLKGRICF